MSKEHVPPTEEELDEWEHDLRANFEKLGSWYGVTIADDVDHHGLRLIAEVRRLRIEINLSTPGNPFGVDLSQLPTEPFLYMDRPSDEIEFLPPDPRFYLHREMRKVMKRDAILRDCRWILHNAPLADIVEQPWMERYGIVTKKIEEVLGDE